MSDSFKAIRHRNKTATVPLPGSFWDGMPATAQLAVLIMESAKFQASTHKQEVGGFQIIVVRDGDKPGEHEVVLSVGAPPETNSGLIVPERKIITN